jgi:hypothetical protein
VKKPQSSSPAFCSLTSKKIEIGSWGAWFPSPEQKEGADPSTSTSLCSAFGLVMTKHWPWSQMDRV